MLSYGAVNLWRLEKADLGQHYRWANTENLRRLVGGPPRPRSSHDLETWFGTVVLDPNQEIYSVKDHTASMLGWVQLFAIDQTNGSADVGVVIDEEQWGKGYGHDSLVALITYAFEDLRLHRLGAEVLSINKPSLSLFEKLGFVKEGTKREYYYTAGRFLDVECYGLLSREFERPAPRSGVRQEPQEMAKMPEDEES